METNQKIKSALDRMVDVFEKRPEAAHCTLAASGTVEDGLKCTVTDGTHTAVMDLPVIMGGEGAGPSPGFHARAGIVGCVAIGIKMMAARAGLALQSVNVGVETDFDDGAPFGLCNKTAAPLETRVSIQVESDAPEDEVSAFIEDVLTRDTWFLALKEAQSVKTSITVDRGA